MNTSAWMLRVIYQDPVGNKPRRVEFSGLTLRQARVRKTLALKSGIASRSVKYQAGQHRLCYESWIAPSKIAGFEIIEYIPLETGDPPEWVKKREDNINILQLANVSR